MTHQAEQLNQQFINCCLWLDDSSRQSQSSASCLLPPSASLCGNPALTPTSSGSYRGNAHTLCTDRPLSGHKPRGQGNMPDQRVCVSCGMSSSPLWRRDAAGGHLCLTCSQQRDNNNRPLLRARRKAVLRAGTWCVNCFTVTTTLWRRNSVGEPVCNACGLYYTLHRVNRPLAMKRDSIQTRNRRKTNKNRRNRTDAELASLAPPTVKATFDPLIAASPPPPPPLNMNIKTFYSVM